MPRDITIVIPAYNEQKRIGATLKDIEYFMQDHEGVIKRIVVVDDGSKDQTAEIVMYFKGKIPVDLLMLTKNCGKWSAINEGLKEVMSGWVLLLDADGSASVFELKRMNISISEGIAVFGTRFSSNAEVKGKSLLRTIVSRGYKYYVLLWYWFAGGRSHITDMQAPFKLFRVEDIDGEIQARRFAGDVELALRLKSLIANHPLKFEHKRGSKIRISTMLQMAVETAKVCWRVKWEQ